MRRGSTGRASCGSCARSSCRCRCRPSSRSALFTFIDKWTDFFGPRVYLNDPDQYPLSIAIQTFQAAHKTDWPLSMAASTVITLPLVIIYFFAQRKFIQGITLTGIKG